MIKITYGLFFIICIVLSFSGQAHQSSHSQISLQQDGNTLTGGWHIAIDDLQRSEGLDVNGDGDLSWGELKQKQGLISSLAKTHLSVSQGKSDCELNASNIKLDNLSAGLYVYLPIKINCIEVIQQISIYYDFLFSFDAQHKAILSIQLNDTAQSIVFSNHSRLFKYDSLRSNKIQTVIEFIWQGIWHIWTGFDHVLFLLCLLLPAALVLHKGKWCDKQGFKATFISTTKIVTAFTLAHSITLALSVFDWVFISSRIVESVIAASVVLAALNNIRPVVHRRLWVLTFIFGLIHGMGFASVLNDVGLPSGLEALALSGFNVGVEIGQLCIVAIILPLIYTMSKKVFYREKIMRIGSFAIASLAVVWLVERVAGMG